MLQGAFPQYPNAQGLPEDTAELYLRMLGETNGRGEELRRFCDGMEAAASWVRSEDHFPTITELLEAIQREARKRAATERGSALPPAWAGLDPQDLPQPELPSGPLDEAGRLAQLARLREIVRGAAIKRAPDDRWREREREQRERKVPPEPCPAHDHTLCGAGPAGARPKPEQ